MVDLLRGVHCIRICLCRRNLVRVREHIGSHLIYMILVDLGPAEVEIKWRLHNELVKVRWPLIGLISWCESLDLNLGAASRYIPNVSTGCL